jgi:hypothetical protein
VFRTLEEGHAAYAQSEKKKIRQVYEEHMDILLEWLTESCVKMDRDYTHHELVNILVRIISKFLPQNSGQRKRVVTALRQVKTTACLGGITV